MRIKVMVGDHDQSELSSPETLGEAANLEVNVNNGWPTDDIGVLSVDKKTDTITIGLIRDVGAA